MISRRKILSTLLTTGLGTAVANAGGMLSLTSHLDLKRKYTMKADELIIEWNVHIFSPDVQRYPFHPKATYQPDVSEQPSDPLAAYLKRLDEENIDRAVIVHPEPYGDDHSLILDCLQREPQRLKGTSLFYPKDSEAPKKLAALVRKEPRIISTRFHAHRGKENYLDSFADPGVRALWKQAVDMGLVIELHIGPNYAKQAGEAIRAFPGCKVLIDHLAEPYMGTAVEYANVLDLAQLPEVYMKLSGIEYFSEDPPLYESARPFTRRVIEAFGPGRMVWGGGTPDIVDAQMQGYAQADISKVKGENLRRLLNW